MNFITKNIRAKTPSLFHLLHYLVCVEEFIDQFKFVAVTKFFEQALFDSVLLLCTLTVLFLCINSVPTKKFECTMRQNWVEHWPAWGRSLSANTRVTVHFDGCWTYRIVCVRFYSRSFFLTCCCLFFIFLSFIFY